MKDPHHWQAWRSRPALLCSKNIKEKLGNRKSIKANAFTKITTDLDGLELEVQHNYMMEDLKQLAMKCYHFDASPLSMVGNKLEENHSVQVRRLCKEASNRSCHHP
jgi:hypothetical protein